MNTYERINVDDTAKAIIADTDFIPKPGGVLWRRGDLIFGCLLGFKCYQHNPSLADAEVLTTTAISLVGSTNFDEFDYWLGAAYGWDQGIDGKPKGGSFYGDDNPHYKQGYDDGHAVGQQIREARLA